MGEAFRERGGETCPRGGGTPDPGKPGARALFRPGSLRSRRHSHSGPVSQAVASRPAPVRKCSTVSLVDLPMTALAVISTAIPPQPSGRMREQVKDVTDVTYRRVFER